MKRKPEPAKIAKYLPAFILPKNSARTVFECIKYTGEYGVATTAISMLIFPSKVPPMVQNYYTREIYDGVFPDVVKVIPTEFEYQTKLSKETVYGLIKATKCASCFVEKREADCAAMQIVFADERITAKCSTPDRAMETTIRAGCTGSFSISVNPSQFIHVISCAHDFCKLGDLISFDFGGKQKVFVVSVGDIKILQTPMRDDWRDER